MGKGNTYMVISLFLFLCLGAFWVISFDYGHDTNNNCVLKLINLVCKSTEDTPCIYLRWTLDGAKTEKSACVKCSGVLSGNWTCYIVLQMTYCECISLV